MLIERVRFWLDARRTNRAQKHRSGWDNPVTGTDLLAVMTSNLKPRRRLP